jgi:hypothetical protein
MGPNRRAQDRERAAAETAARAKRAEAERQWPLPPRTGLVVTLGFNLGAEHRL